MRNISPITLNNTPHGFNKIPMLNQSSKRFRNVKEISLDDKFLKKLDEPMLSTKFEAKKIKRPKQKIII